MGKSEDVPLFLLLEMCFHWLPELFRLIAHLHINGSLKNISVPLKRDIKLIIYLFS